MQKTEPNFSNSLFSTSVPMKRIIFICDKTELPPLGGKALPLFVQNQGALPQRAFPPLRLSECD